MTGAPQNTNNGWLLRPRGQRFALLAIAAAALTTTLATDTAFASIDSELAYHRGVVAYGEDDLEAARAHFEAVIDENPNDASALQFLGLIENKQGNKDGAIDYFERAVLADPEDVEIRFALGVALLHVDRADQAGIEFDRVLAVEPDNGQAEFYAGVADYRRQAYAQTVKHMKAAISLDSSLRMHSRYYIGLAEVFMGNLDASTSAFADAASLSPSDPLAISADQLGKSIQPESRWWGLDAGLGLEYDSNPTSVGAVSVFVAGSVDTIELKPKDNVLGSLSLNTYYDLIDSSSATARIGYSGYINEHTETEEVDQLTHVLWTDLGWSEGDFRFGVRVDVSTTDLDLDEDFREMRRVAPSVTYVSSDFGVTQLLYQYHDFDYRIPLASELDPDGDLHILGLSQFLYLPAPFTYARVGAAYERSETQGDEFDYDGVKISGGLGLELPLDMRAGVLIQYIYRDYSNKSTLDLIGSDDVAAAPTNKRTDHIGVLKLDLTVPLDKYLEFAVRGSFSFHDSNVAIFDYNRHVVGTYMTFTF